MNQRQTETAIKSRLQHCRKSTYSFRESTKANILRALRDKSISKKAVCKVYSMTYQQLKQALYH
ncbi:TPA: hypothetical protein I6167_002363 [Vibrio cholerae]|nr:hypothetical protein [Vibrio cholerae]